ncbi:hypothetical protein C4D60_Mb10t23450 [Musa balbisiana]|uniref:Uncharacterized protein n=1 Tax=Musa balbisiana TaxID=52838 RepID=A0A4S8IZ67_MUSBA|nr:hypothetical protein C4D60_Mb10t23450 [Musa balbisiana]
MNPTVPVANKLLDRIPQAYNIQKARLWRAEYFDPLVENTSRSALASSIPPLHITKIYFVEGAVVVLLLNLVTSNIGSRRSDRSRVRGGKDRGQCLLHTFQNIACIEYSS